MEVTYVHTVRGRSRIFRINRQEDMLINERPPRLSVEQLAITTGSVFYPLDVEVGFDGKFLCVCNPQVVRNRWLLKKEALAAYYCGEQLEKYVSIFDRLISSDTKLNAIFEKDIFMKLYFNRIYHYDLQSHKPAAFWFAALPSMVPLKFHVAVKTISGSGGNIGLLHEGFWADERNNWEIESGLSEHFDQPVSQYDRPSGSYTCRYILNNRSKAIESIKAVCELRTSHFYQTKVEIIKLQAGQEPQLNHVL